MSEILKSLSMPELNAYAVLVNCCIKNLGGEALNDLKYVDRPGVYTEDLIERGWNERDAIEIMYKLLSKDLIELEKYSYHSNSYKGMFLTEHWKEFYSLWPCISKYDKKVDTTELPQNLAI